MKEDRICINKVLIFLLGISVVIFSVVYLNSVNKSKVTTQSKAYEVVRTREFEEPTCMTVGGVCLSKTYYPSGDYKSCETYSKNMSFGYYNNNDQHYVRNNIVFASPDVVFNNKPGSFYVNQKYQLRNFRTTDKSRVTCYGEDVCCLPIKNPCFNGATVVYKNEIYALTGELQQGSFDEDFYCIAREIFNNDSTFNSDNNIACRADYYIRIPARNNNGSTDFEYVIATGQKLSNGCEVIEWDPQMRKL